MVLTLPQNTGVWGLVLDAVVSQRGWTLAQMF